MLKVKKNDLVKVLSGKDKGKTGKVISIFLSEKKALVEGVNFSKRHLRKTQDNPQGGIISREAAIAISKLMLVCPRCNKPARVGLRVNGENKVRVCKKCKEPI